MPTNPTKVVVSPDVVDSANRVQAVGLSSTFYFWTAPSSPPTFADWYAYYFRWLPLAQLQAQGYTWGGAILAPYGIISGITGYMYGTDQQGVGISWLIGGGVVGGTYSSSDYGTAGGNTTLQKLTCDRTYAFQAAAYCASTGVRGDTPVNFPEYSRYTSDSENIVNLKTNPALAGVAATPSVSSVSFNSAVINASTYTPNTYESVATVRVQLKKSTDAGYADVAVYSSQSGYNQIAYGPIYLTGLSPSTIYNVRVTGHRFTRPEDDFYSTEIAFTTTASTPDLVTGPATAVGATSASLHATVNPHTIPTVVTFEWGTISGMYSFTADPGYGSTGDGARDVSFPLDGLTANTTYYYRAKATYGPVVPLYGSEVSFTTTADPTAEARDEDHMQTIKFDGQFGTARTLTFPLKEVAGSSSNLYYTSTKPEQGDVTIMHTTSAGATTVQGTSSDNAFGLTDPVGGYLYTLQLSAAEMSAEIIDVFIHDVTPTPVFRDQHIQIRTVARLTSLDLNATNAAVDTTALNCIGKGTGHGISAVGGQTGLDINAIFESNWLFVFEPAAVSAGTTIQLPTEASPTTGFYVGSMVHVVGGGVGNGQGQSRVITAYEGSGRIATLDSGWNTAVQTSTVCVIGPGARTWDMKPAAELSTVPSPVDSYGKYLQLIFQRFAFKIMQETQQQTWYDSNDIEKFVRTVFDDGGTQKLERLGDYTP